MVYPASRTHNIRLELHWGYDRFVIVRTTGTHWYNHNNHNRQHRQCIWHRCWAPICRWECHRRPAAQLWPHHRPQMATPVPSPTHFAPQPRSTPSQPLDFNIDIYYLQRAAYRQSVYWRHRIMDHNRLVLLPWHPSSFSNVTMYVGIPQASHLMQEHAETNAHMPTTCCHTYLYPVPHFAGLRQPYFLSPSKKDFVSNT